MNIVKQLYYIPQGKDRQLYHRHYHSLQGWLNFYMLNIWTPILDDLVGHHLFHYHQPSSTVYIKNRYAMRTCTKMQVQYTKTILFGDFLQGTDQFSSDRRGADFPRECIDALLRTWLHLLPLLSVMIWSFYTPNYDLQYYTSFLIDIFFKSSL